jgi:hypothetical protein
MSDTQTFNYGNSDYSNHKIQPWDIIEAYGLNFFEGCVIKRVLRTKSNQDHLEDLKKARHELTHCINHNLFSKKSTILKWCKVNIFPECFLRKPIDHIDIITTYRISPISTKSRIIAGLVGDSNIYSRRKELEVVKHELDFLIEYESVLHIND